MRLAHLLPLLLVVACATSSNGNSTRKGRPTEVEDPGLEDTSTGDTGTGGGGTGSGGAADFGDDFAAAVCDKVMECGGAEALTQLGYSTVAECTDAFAEQFAASITEATCPDFDPAMADACLDAYASMDCATLATSPPTQCEAVCG